MRPASAAGEPRRGDHMNRWLDQVSASATLPFRDRENLPCLTYDQYLAAERDRLDGATERNAS